VEEAADVANDELGLGSFVGLHIAASLEYRVDFIMTILPRLMWNVASLYRLHQLHRQASNHFTLDLCCWQ